MKTLNGRNQRSSGDDKDRTRRAPSSWAGSREAAARREGKASLSPCHLLPVTAPTPPPSTVKPLQLDDQAGTCSRNHSEHVGTRLDLRRAQETSKTPTLPRAGSLNLEQSQVQKPKRQRSPISQFKNGLDTVNRAATRVNCK